MYNRRAHITTTLNLVKWQDTGLNPDATYMLFDALDECRRFEGHDIVQGEYADTTAQHACQVMRDSRTLIEACCDKGSIISYSYDSIILPGLAVHDAGECFVEPQTAHSETDTDLQAKLAKYSITKTERDIAIFLYGLANSSYQQKRPELFYDTITQGRAACRPPNFNPYKLSADDALHFFENTYSLIDKKTEAHAEELGWNSKQHTAQQRIFTNHYDRIENPRDFPGTFAKAMEKLNGTQKVNRTLRLRIKDRSLPPDALEAYDTYTLLSVASRYEKMLRPMYGHISNMGRKEERFDAARLLGALAMLCYKTTLQTVSHGRDDFLLYKPGHDAETQQTVKRGDVMQKYQNAIEDFETKGVLRLPGAEAGCLARTKETDKVGLVMAATARNIITPAINKLHYNRLHC